MIIHENVIRKKRENVRETNRVIEESNPRMPLIYHNVEISSSGNFPLRLS